MRYPARILHLEGVALLFQHGLDFGRRHVTKFNMRLPSAQRIRPRREILDKEEFYSVQIRSPLNPVLRILLHFEARTTHITLKLEWPRAKQIRLKIVWVLVERFFGVDDIPNTLFLVEPDGSINYGNITTFSSADYAFLFSFAQKITDEDDFKTSFGVNAKIIYRTVGHFATAWGFGVDAGFKLQKNRWSLGIVAKDLTTTFNAWSFHFDEKEQEVLYLTENQIPVKSTELTSPRLTVGNSYNFRLGSSINFLAEADFDFTFDGERNTVIGTRTLSIDPHAGIEASIKNVFFVRAGISNFQRALADGDTTNQKKVWIYQPSLGAGFKINNVSIDYAFTNLANQSNPLYTNVFSLKIDLIKKVKK